MTELSFERGKIYLSRVVMWGVFHEESAQVLWLYGRDQGL